MAEQYLLGILIRENSAYERVDLRLESTHFSDRYHGRIFETLRSEFHVGGVADTAFLVQQFQSDSDFEKRGAERYLSALVNRAPAAANTSRYARTIYELAMRRGLIRIGREMVQTARSAHDDLTADRQIAAAQNSLSGLGHSEPKGTGLLEFSDSVSGALLIAAGACTRWGRPSGLSTGLAALDRRLGGLHHSDLILVAGRPAAGKTTLAKSIAFNVARNYAWEPTADGSRRTISGGVVAFFSLEASAQQLALGMVAETAGIPVDQVRRGDISPGEFDRLRDSAQTMLKAPLYIDADVDVSSHDLAVRARRLSRVVGIDLIVVDGLPTADSPTGGPAGSMGKIARGLKALAMELQVPVIAFVRLPEEPDGRPDAPHMADLRQVGLVEKDADVVLFLHRRRAAAVPASIQISGATGMIGGGLTPRTVDVIIAKQRRGPIGMLSLAYDAEFQLFRDPPT